MQAARDRLMGLRDSDDAQIVEVLQKKKGLTKHLSLGHKHGGLIKIALINSGVAESWLEPNSNISDMN